MHAGERIWRTRVHGGTRLVFLGLLIAFSAASEDVYLRSSHGGLSSAMASINLRWIKGEKGSRPNDAVTGSLNHNHSTVSKREPSGEPHKAVNSEEAFVCRARHGGIWLPGRLNASSTACKVSQDDIVYAYDTYEVLQNEDGRTKLTWVHWDRTVFPPQGAVDVDGSGTYYVAQREGISAGEEGGNERLIGKLDLRERTHHVAVVEIRTEKEKQTRRRMWGRRDPNQLQEETERTYVNGKVLVAADPKYYELYVTELGPKPKDVQSKPVTLATGRLVNDGSQLDGHALNEHDQSSLVHVVLYFESEYSILWEQGKDLLNDLPTTVVNREEDGQDNGQGRAVDNFNWGQRQIWRLNGEKRVERRLLPGTAANVSLVANKTETSVPYTAQLTTFFEDDSILSRNVSGTKKIQILTHLQEQVGPAYFLDNGTLAPTPSLPNDSVIMTVTEAYPPKEKSPPNVSVNLHFGTTNKPSLHISPEALTPEIENPSLEFTNEARSNTSEKGPHHPDPNRTKPSTEKNTTKTDIPPLKPPPIIKGETHFPSTTTPDSSTEMKYEYDFVACKTEGKKTKCPHTAENASHSPSWGKAPSAIYVLIAYVVILVSL